MVNHSSFYRNDPETSPDNVLREFLDTHYLLKRPNLDVSHPKLLVVLSGGNAVGKSMLSAQLEAKLHALVIENDEIKQLLVDSHPDIEKSDLGDVGRMTWQYTLDLYRRLSNVSPNGLVVRDAVIDWYYDRILPLFVEQGYAIFVVRFELSRVLREKLLNNRGGKDWVTKEKLMSLMDEHDVYSAKFLSQYPADVILDDQTLFDHDIVVDAVRARLELLNGS